MSECSFIGIKIWLKISFSDWFSASLKFCNFWKFRKIFLPQKFQLTQKLLNFDQAISRRKFPQGGEGSLKIPKFSYSNPLASMRKISNFRGGVFFRCFENLTKSWSYFLLGKNNFKNQGDIWGYLRSYIYPYFTGKNEIDYSSKFQRCDDKFYIVLNYSVFFITFC